MCSSDLLVLDGSPTMRFDGGEWEMKPGDLVCLPPGPQGGHQVRGPGTVLILSANGPLDAVEYPESGKIGVRPPGVTLRLAEPTNTACPPCCCNLSSHSHSEASLCRATALYTMRGSEPAVAPGRRGESLVASAGVSALVSA